MMRNGAFQGPAPVMLLTLPWVASQGPIAGGVGSLRPDPVQVRAAAVEAGLASLATVPVPEPAELERYLRDGPAARQAAVALGKALFWDMQVGSDGQACASCHFHAGADNRAKNQLNPGGRDVDPSRRTFDSTRSGQEGGPNYALREEDFPFHELQDPEQENYLARSVLFDSDDVVSSQGVFSTRFLFTVDGFPFDVGYQIRDDVFEVGRTNTRRVEPRNTPTVFNAVFNFTNFWDGRAHNVFNGVSVFGPLDEDAVIWVAQGSALVPHAVRLENSSLASQAVGPPISDLEMSYFDRSFRDVARKLLDNRPLAIQLVHPDDSVLGPYSRAFVFGAHLFGLPGLDRSYAELIQMAFRPEYTATDRTIGGTSQMEANFTLFFGLSIQLYEATLVTDETPFDRFMEGDDGALSEDQLIGLLTFLRTPESRHPAFTPEIGVGNCIRCHGGPEFTDAAFTSLARNGEPELIELQEMSDLLGGRLAAGDETAFLDSGFSNIGVRPSEEDLGRGGTELGKPLSFVRQALAGLAYAPELPECGPRCPDLDRVAVDGAFKVPGLRNVELTGPYFHNGGQSTLEQVVEFYDRQGDFGDVNLGQVDRNLALVALDDLDEEPLIAFLLALTDQRVPLEKAPFDHPQLYIANGHEGDHEALTCDFFLRACDDVVIVRAVGRNGRPAAGLPPLEPFLGLDPEDE